MDHYAVMGNPVKHSLSPQINALFAKQTQQSIQYDKIESPLTAFKKTVDEFVRGGGKGFNITVPFKRAAYELADALDESAKRCGVVNVIHVNNHKLIGHNTDGRGLLTDITQNLKFTLKHKRVLLIGVGGAAQGVLPTLLDEAPSSVVIVNRTLEKAQALVAQFHHPLLTACGFDDLAQESFDLIINATTSSVSMLDLPLPATIFSAQSLSYDMMYNRDEPTTFVKWSLAHGATRAVDGLGMLVEQAALSFHIWRGILPETRSVLTMLSSS